MATSEFGEGPGRTGYRRDLRPDEVLRLERATNPASDNDSAEAALVRELEMEKRTRVEE